MKNLKLFGLVLLTAILCGMISDCNRYVVHPGAVNTFDSVTADVLLQAKTLLDSTRTKVNAKTSPAWSQLAKAYDTANASYKVWRSFALVPGGSPDATTLKNELADLATAVANYKKVTGTP